MTLDADSAFLNTGAPTHQHTSTGGISTPDVTIIHESLQELCDWSPCDFLSSNHRPITITHNLPPEQLMGQKRLVRDWKKGDIPAITNKVEDQIRQECENRKLKVEEMYAHMRAILLKAAPKNIGLKGWEWLDGVR